MNGNHKIILLLKLLILELEDQKNIESFQVYTGFRSSFWTHFFTNFFNYQALIEELL